MPVSPGLGVTISAGVSHYRITSLVDTLRNARRIIPQRMRRRRLA
jgi:hypothetical protein